jgi:hypothetical protein
MVTMPELKPLRRTDFVAMDGDFGPQLVCHTHPGGKWTDVENVQIREKVMVDALRDADVVLTVLLDDLGQRCSDERLTRDRISVLIGQYDAEEHQ